ncbi:sulfite exporter TauE/SafE family protein, partial [bacterium]|nr:sulfite exporter TauE/SafE family protein [bacterium]
GLIISGLYAFNKKGMINYRVGLTICIPALLGSFLGASLVLQINVVILKYVIAIITMVILFFTLLKPEIGIEKTKHVIKKHEYLIGAALSFFLGIYAGFYGAGTGTFVSYILILLFGQTFLESAATRKTVTLLPSLLATTIFAFAGVIIYSLGIALFMGNFIGSYIGVHYSDRIGNVWIKRLFFGIVLIMALKLII